VHPEPDAEGVVALYDRLVAVSPSPAARVNRAAALAAARGPTAGLAALDAVTPAPGDHRALVLRAELHHQLGQVDLARARLAEAVALARNDVERRHLQRRLDSW
jgi:RNA polymerase sigma-70 factor (ECF subfamily)